MRVIRLTGDDIERGVYEAAQRLPPGETIQLHVAGWGWQLKGAIKIFGDRVSVLTVREKWFGNCRPPTSLVRLELDFADEKAIQFAIAAIEQCPGLKWLTLQEHAPGDVEALFAALGRRGVTTLTLVSYEGFAGRPREVEGLWVCVHKRYFGGMSFTLEGLACCTKLTDLTLGNCDLAPCALTNLPESVARLDLRCADLDPTFDWSFLQRGGLTDLTLCWMDIANARTLRGALAARLQRAPLARLRISDGPDFALPFHRVRHLEFGGSDHREVLEAVEAALWHPDSHLRELTVNSNERGVMACLKSAVRDPRCSLTKLAVVGISGEIMMRQFNQRRRLLVLLQARVRRLHSSLWRLPVEMFRLVGRM